VPRSVPSVRAPARCARCAVDTATQRGTVSTRVRRPRTTCRTRRRTRSGVTAGRAMASASTAWVVLVLQTAPCVATTRSTRPICCHTAMRACLTTTTSLTTMRYLTYLLMVDRGRTQGVIPPKWQKLDLTTDAEYVANLVNVNMHVQHCSLLWVCYRAYLHNDIFGRPFVKRFALCYHTAVCPVCNVGV